MELKKVSDLKSVADVMKQSQIEAEHRTLMDAEQPTVADIMEQVAVIDTYIHTAKKQAHRLAIKDSTSITYQFTLGLLEMLVTVREGVIGDYVGQILGKVETEKVGLVLEDVARVK